ncbi:hypothetical protein [Plantactinospora endophytica]|uniref:Secreted protein n=1 Tax=Plantactinospora endophytica TaxID=673535 RepID=A0ABQ4E5W9_9ACTN|nr:hypothetical protein [Plantactinospora endophytica]GIG90098.1 hypothetical protein Pen02_50340 [Plantactinospora endophytica]
MDIELDLPVVPDQAPVWLLDVDGVVNARRPGWGRTPCRADVWSEEDRCEYPLSWADALVDRMRALHDSGVVELRWCTTWCPEADVLERLWRLPVLDRALVCEPVPKGPEGWPVKRAAAHAVLAAGRTLVWTDDEAIPEGDRVLDRAVARGIALLIAPDPARGLRPADIDEIEAFAARHAAV